MTFAETERAVKDIILSKPDCQSCGVGAGCIGCPEMIAYEERRDKLRDSVGTDTFNAMADYVILQQSIETKTLELQQLTRKAQKAKDTVNRYFKEDVFVTIFSTDKGGIKQLISTLKSSGLVYSANGMYMVQTYISDMKDLDGCFKFHDEARATRFCARNPGEFAAVVPE